MGQELIQHDKAGALYIHRLTNWRFQDTASRLDVDNQFKQSDLDKMCYDMQDEQYYLLVAVDGAGVPTWYPLVSAFTPTGEANTASSEGAGVSLVLPKSGVDLPFKSLVAGTNVTFTIGADTVTINADLSGGPFAPLSHVGAGGAAHAVASGVSNGFMLAADYTLLHSLVSNATHTGDVTGSTALTIAAHAVTFAKLQAASGMKRLLGRGDSGAGDFQEITLGAGLDMVGQELRMSTVGIGDMLKSIYDTDDDGVVDNSELLEGQTSAYHLARANHTGTQLSTTISDFTEATQDVIGAALVAGTNVTITYNDGANTITIASTSFEPILGAGTVGQYYRGDKTWQTLDKTAVGLANVDNTSDAIKNAAVATLTNKVISGTSNTITDVPQSGVINLVVDLAAKQPLDTDLTAIAALVSATDKFPYATGAGAWSLGTVTSYARTLLDDVLASDARTTLGLGTIATQAASAVAITGGAIDGTTLGATTPATAKVTSLDVSLDINFSATGKRLQADMGNVTVSNRWAFQSNVTNGASHPSVLPNGTSQSASIRVYNNSAPDNSSLLRLACSATTTTIGSDASGSGTLLPLNINVGGSDAINISTAQNVGFGVSSPSTDCKLQVSNGISLGNTANAVTTVCDYYNEPTWTSVAKGTTAAGIGTYSVQVGQCTRIGDRADIFMDLQQSAHTGTGNIKFGDLPFTSKAAIRQPLVISATGLVITAGNRLEAFIAAGATEITVQQVTALGVATAVPIPAGAATFLISGSYKVA